MSSTQCARDIGRGHTITSRELMWSYACGWDVRGVLTLNSMAQIHTSVTLLTSRDLMWSSGRLRCQHASERRAGILSSVVCPALHHFPHSHKRQDFRKTLLNIRCVFRVSVQVLPENIFMPRRNWARYDLKFDTHGSVHRRLLSRNTNKMQLCNRIYYSEVFLKAQHVSSGHTAHHQEL